MKIALMHFRVGETDGVSLEMEKWKLILEEMGHEVMYVAGSGGVADVILADTLHYANAANDILVDHIYHKKDDGRSEKDIRSLLESYAAEVKEQLAEIFDSYDFDLIIPNNVLSLGWNLGVGMALAALIEEKGLRCLCHHHDFHWERTLYSNPKYDWVNDILEEVFPVISDNVSHVVINTIAQREIRERRSIDATVVPNVFDYDTDFMVRDDYNGSIRKDLGFDDNDILFLQATRIVERKGIELTIRTLHELQKKLSEGVGRRLYDGRILTEHSRIKLVLVGLNEDHAYFNKLAALAEALEVDMVYVGDRVDFERRMDGGCKVYSLWDAYFLADIISYPSLLEGFGNQLLEGICARKPILLYEYPVYGDYIRDFGLSAVSLGETYTCDSNGLASLSGETLDFAADELVSLLCNREKYGLVADRNYEIGVKHFSYRTLKEMLTTLLGEECPNPLEV